MNEQEKTKKSVHLKTVLISSAIILFVLAIVTAVLTYFFPQNALSSRIRDVVPYPAIVVNGSHPIVFRDIDSDMKSIRRFYESQSDDLSKAGLRTDFSTPDGQKRLMIREKELLNKMIEDVAIRILAQDRGITITPDATAVAVDQKIKALGNNRDTVTKQLDRLYGWNITDFEQKIVQPELYKDSLSKVYAQGIDTSSEAQKNIKSAKNDMSQGLSFEDVSKKYSDSKTAQDGGELGWIFVSNLAPEIRQAIEKQKINQMSDIIESSLGFHIVVLEERKQEQGQDIVRIKQIFSRKLSFSDWLSSQMKQMNIIVLFKGYMWDKETARIEFKQPEMRSFEQNALQTSEGDASLLF